MRIRPARIPALRTRLVSLGLLTAAALVFGACAATTTTDARGDFSLYGNWCGPGHPKEGATPTPINETDAACRSHDRCYANNGYLNRLCDNQLIVRLRSVRTTDPVEEAARQSIIAYFEKSPKVD